MLSEALPSSAEAPPAAASPDQAAGLRRWMAAMALGAAGGAGDGAGADQSSCPLPAEPAPGPAARPPPAAVAAPARALDPASAAPRETAPCTLMVLGLGESRSGLAAEVLEAWARAGKRWVGDPARWRIVAVDAASPQLAPLCAQQPRWALWVEGEGDAFRRAYRVLRQLAAAGGPRRLLALHPPGWPRRGLLANLQQVAASCLGIELVVLAR
ncbi:hypothetical protein [Thauera chlorobenzoica]|uniref:Uncharacterized protein n=1 Tax=Thauera chlorobenzoica TaxID=96773 RepID=A0A1H5W1S6_9RHOO|nr:hypothetical protein [Thauera chlorobenzoica]APR03307.1 hypothetical protein Tchl_0435 [Thauera chlorobenzoica]SEF92757.1 hypothetical protein SAMN05216242_11024 [Thauera chlorobenzoica]